MLCAVLHHGTVGLCNAIVLHCSANCKRVEGAGDGPTLAIEYLGGLLHCHARAAFLHAANTWHKLDQRLQHINKMLEVLCMAPNHQTSMFIKYNLYTYFILFLYSC